MIMYDTVHLFIYTYLKVKDQQRIRAYKAAQIPRSETQDTCIEISKSKQNCSIVENE
jgi:hypothetical protein